MTRKIIDWAKVFALLMPQGGAQKALARILDISTISLNKYLSNAREVSQTDWLKVVEKCRSFTSDTNPDIFYPVTNTHPDEVANKLKKRLVEAINDANKTGSNRLSTTIGNSFAVNNWWQQQEKFEWTGETLTSQLEVAFTTHLDDFILGLRFLRDAIPASPTLQEQTAFGGVYLWLLSRFPGKQTSFIQVSKSQSSFGSLSVCNANHLGVALAVRATFPGEITIGPNDSGRMVSLQTIDISPNPDGMPEQQFGEENIKTRLQRSLLLGSKDSFSQPYLGKSDYSIAVIKEALYDLGPVNEKMPANSNAVHILDTFETDGAVERASAATHLKSLQKVGLEVGLPVVQNVQSDKKIADALDEFQVNAQRYFEKLLCLEKAEVAKVESTKPEPKSEIAVPSKSMEQQMPSGTNINLTFQVGDNNKINQSNSQKITNTFSPELVKLQRELDTFIDQTSLDETEKTVLKSKAITVIEELQTSNSWKTKAFEGFKKIADGLDGTGKISDGVVKIFQNLPTAIDGVTKVLP